MTLSLNLQVNNLPIFGVGHSLGSVIHLLIGITHHTAECRCLYFL